MDELIRAKDIKPLSAKVGPDEIHLKILKHLSSNESFIEVICKLFEKCIECEIIPYI